MLSKTRDAGSTQTVPARRANGSVKAKREKSIGSVLYHVRKCGMLADDNSLRRLRNWLSREAYGSNDDLRAPFFSGGIATSKKTLVRESRESVVKRLWDEVLSTKPALPENYQKLIFQVESDQAKKIGPQSSYLPWEVDGPDKVQSVYSDKPKTARIDDRALDRACERVQSLLPRDSVRITSIHDAVGHERTNPHAVGEKGMDITTSSGLPHCKSPWHPRDSQLADDMAESRAAYEYIIRKATEAHAKLIKGIPVTWWAIAGKRLAQSGADIRKRKRLIIAIEKAEPVLWKTFTPELLKLLSEKTEFVALNDLPVIDHCMARLLQAAYEGNRSLIGGDYSGYDASLPPWLLQRAGDIVGRWVRGGELFVSALTKSLIENVYLVTPNRVWPPTPSSMKSGSGGTNLLDSICNLIVVYYGEEIRAYKVENACVQGDDFVLDAIGGNPEAIHTVASCFGLTAHPEKQMYVPEATQFLQKLHLRGYLGGMASVFRTLGSILSYERLMVNPKIWNGIADIIRARAQLDVTVFNPYFEVLVNFVKNGDKYKLGEGSSPGELLKAAGPAGLDILQRSFGAPSKSISRARTAQEQFALSAVNRVLRGEVVPPLGSVARFEFAYGDRV